MTWRICGAIPMNNLPSEQRYFVNFLKANRPPGFIPPPQREK